VSGLPKTQFDYALLWLPFNNFPKRNHVLPSWSWAGWHGQCSYELGLVYSSSISCSPRGRNEIRSEIDQLHWSSETPKRLLHRLGTTLSPQGRETADGPPAVPAKDILHFSAWAVANHKFCFRLRDTDYSSDVYAPDGKHCGRCFRMTGYLSTSSELQDALDISPDKYDFILLSRSQVCVGRFGYRYAPWDGDFYGCEGWCVMHVMLIRWMPGEHYAERVVLCQIHEEAWLNAEPKKDIVLG
jgi:hypothetical protein